MRLWTFLALGHGKLNPLPFNQSLESRPINRAEVCEYIGATLALNKAKAFVFIEPFNGSSNSIRHNKFQSSQKAEAIAGVGTFSAYLSIS